MFVVVSLWCVYIYIEMFDSKINLVFAHFSSDIGLYDIGELCMISNNADNSW